MERQLIDSEGNVFIPDTDSYTFEIVLTREDGGGFANSDKVLVSIKNEAFDKTYLEKLLDIPNGTAYFRVSVEEAKKIPAGDHFWSYSVLINARELPAGGYTGDDKITPFNGYRTYHVEEDPSNARN